MKNISENLIIYGVVALIVFGVFFSWTYFMGIPPRQLESSLIVSLICTIFVTPLTVHQVNQKAELERLRRLVGDKEDTQ